MPFTKVTTAMTAATPMTTPSKVSTDRSLFAHNDCRAMRMASRLFMQEKHDCSRQGKGLRQGCGRGRGPRILYNEGVADGPDGRSLRREESPNSVEQCAR